MKYNISRQELANIKAPEDTRTYRAVSHKRLIDLTLDALNQAGFIVSSEKYTAAREGQVANGRYVISNIADEEMCLQIAWQNSYDKSVSLKFAIGVNIFICGNGSVFGDIGCFKKKHQGTIQEFTPAAITEYIARAGDVFARIQKERDIMKKITLDLRKKSELIGRMLVEKQFISISQTSLIMKELIAPTFDYGGPDSLWTLYQYTTQALRDDHPTLWMNDHSEAHKFFAEEAGIPVIEAEINVPEPGSHPQGEIFDGMAQVVSEKENNELGTI